MTVVPVILRRLRRFSMIAVVVVAPVIMTTAFHVHHHHRMGSKSYSNFVTRQIAATTTATTTRTRVSQQLQQQQHRRRHSLTTLSMIFNRQRTTKLFNLDANNNNYNGKIIGGNNNNDYTTTESIGTDYIPLEITCDPDNMHPDCLSDIDVPGYMGYDRERFLNLFIPAISPLVAFLTFDFIAETYSTLIELLDTTKNWVAVDGGAFQARIMTPAINGLVVPATSLLFATLISTTITTLRQRQVDVRNAINMEAGELRALECYVDSYTSPSHEQDLSRDYLIQYTSRLLAECHPRMGSGEDVINPRRGMDSELNGLTRLINKGYGTSVIPNHIADECYVCIARLREQRTKRISALQSVYPFLHYVILVVLAIAECIAFLMETDQDVLVFLNSIQIKILWSMLVGTFVTCFTVVSDLRAPFSGSYQISASVGQLHTIKLTLQASKQISYNKTQREQREMEEQRELDERTKQFSNFNGAIVNGVAGVGGPNGDASNTATIATPAATITINNNGRSNSTTVAIGKMNH